MDIKANGTRRWKYLKVDDNGLPRRTDVSWFRKGDYIDELHQFFSRFAEATAAKERRLNANIGRLDKALHDERRVRKGYKAELRLIQYFLHDEDLRKVLAMAKREVAQVRTDPTPSLPYEAVNWLADEIGPFILRGGSLAANIVLNIGNFFKYYSLDGHAQTVYELVRDHSAGDISLELGAEAGLVELYLRSPKPNLEAITRGFDRIVKEDPTLTTGRYEADIFKKITRVRELAEKTPADFLLRASYLLEVIAGEQDQKIYRKKLFIGEGNITSCLKIAVTRDNSLVEPAIKIVNHYWEIATELGDITLKALIKASAEITGKEREKIHSIAVDYARQLRDGKVYGQAIALCKEVIAIDLVNIHAHYFAGTTYEKMGNELGDGTMGKVINYRAAVRELEQTGKGKTHTDALHRVREKLSALTSA